MREVSVVDAVIKLNAGRCGIKRKRGCGNEMWNV